MTADLDPLRRLHIEPLDRSKHDRAAFSCGEPRVDTFLKQHAARQQDSDFSRVFVACLDGGAEIAGFYAMNAHAIDATTLPEEARRRLPRYPHVPAIYLSVLGVSAAYQGRGIGSWLLADAFRRAASIADSVGAHFLVLDALSENAARLYRRQGFADLPGHEPRMLIRMAVIRAAMERAEGG
jgi:ribosomal protein S18 acetylase RimI-like enzyme